MPWHAEHTCNALRIGQITRGVAGGASCDTRALLPLLLALGRASDTVPTRLCSRLGSLRHLELTMPFGQDVEPLLQQVTGLTRLDLLPDELDGAGDWCLPVAPAVVLAMAQTPSIKPIRGGCSLARCACSLSWRTFALQAPLQAQGGATSSSSSRRCCSCTSCGTWCTA
jgi:hypothetical protein